MVRSAVRRTLRGSSAVVAQSANTSENARKYYGFEGPIEIIPLGIRVPSVTPASRRALGLPDDVFLGVTVGRLVRRKALDLLLRAVAQPQNSSVYLALVGDGPELGSLRTLAAQLGLEERVLFLGRVDEVRKWQILAVSDAYLSSTMHEGFGMVYLEAMASGIPIVTPDHGGQIDFLRDGETGYLAPAGDEGALGSAIARLHRAPEVRTEMGRHNLALAPRFRIERCAASYEALFDGLIRKWTRMNPVPR